MNWTIIAPELYFLGTAGVFFALAVEKGYFYLLLIAMINVAVSLYYYALVVKAAYFLEPEKEGPAIHLTLPLRGLIWLVVVLIVAGGMQPDALYSLATVAAGLLK